MADEAIESDADAIGEVQLLLSEVRTALSLMRTGIAILALPLSVFSVLVATSRYYDALNVPSPWTGEPKMRLAPEPTINAQ